MTFSIIDLETDGLLDTVTKIHCLSIYTVYENGILPSSIYTLTEYDDMRTFLLGAEAIIGHNIIRFDIPVIKKILGIEIKCKMWDSLALSWYLFPKAPEHGLAYWGLILGVQKPKVEDWVNSDLNTYIHRCEADVAINVRLYNLQFEKLVAIYGDIKTGERLIGYLSFKMQCAAEQEEVMWRLDVPKAEKNLQFLKDEEEPKIQSLSAAMPIVTLYKQVARPKELYKKDGSVSVVGERWFNHLKTLNLPDYHVGTLKVPSGKQELGNPGSPKQVKDWLFSLGWVPDFFRYVKETDGTNRAIPQVNNAEGDGLSESVEALIPLAPDLELLDGLTKIKHRKGLLQGFLRDKDENGFLKAEIVGLTNTLRFQHTTIVNLPTVVKAYGQYVRGVLIAPDEKYILCGSDMAGIEESTKHHYMFFYDPEGVKKVRVKGFDPHLNLCIVTNMITVEDMEFYKDYEKNRLELKEDFAPTDADKKRYTHIKDIRINKGKKANFGCLYGAGPAKIALTARLTFKESKMLHTGFWIVNKAVKLVAKYTIHKTIEGQMWLWNPVSQFWYSLRAEKDKFSTLNQGTAVYAFDIQVKNVRKRGVKICGQFHDEWVAPILREDREKVKQIAEDAIVETNEELKLNIKLGISIEFGENYADIH